MNTSSWIECVSAAATEAEVVAIVRDYMAAAAHGVTALPSDCKSVNVTNSQAVFESAYRLAANPSSGQDFLATFFARASRRLTELNGR